jgi:hypothetical protein
MFHRADFLPGQYFDIRLEVHSPINGSEQRIGGPDENFTFTIAKKGGNPVPATKFFDVEDPKLESWNFTWYEGETFLSLILLIERLCNWNRSVCARYEQAICGQCHGQSISPSCFV